MRLTPILIDTGPIVALIDSRDANHARCIDGMGTLRIPLITTVPCWTEVLYLLGRSGGIRAQDAAWELHAAGVVSIDDLGSTALVTARKYMNLFADVPCDFAEASLLALAEREDVLQIATLNSDFYAYRVREAHLSLHLIS